MGIGTSDGKYYPSEMDMALDDLSNTSDKDMFLHMVPEYEKYDDTATPQQKAIDGSIYNSLKLDEKDMEDRLNDRNTTWNDVEQTPVTSVEYKIPPDQPTLDDAVNHIVHTRIDRELLTSKEFLPYTLEAYHRTKELYEKYDKNPELKKELDKWAKNSGNGSSMDHYGRNSAFGSLFGHIIATVSEENLEDENISPELRQDLEWQSKFDMGGRAVPDYRKFLDRYKKTE